MDNWEHSPLHIRWIVACKVFLHTVRSTPRPVKFSLAAGVISLASLLIMPTQPLSILFAYGLGIASAMILVQK